MGEIITDYGITTVAAAFAVMLFAGFVKGVVGFALPMIAISGIGSLMSAEVAIAAIILPATVANLQQAFRTGFGAARETLRKYWRLNLVLVLLIGVFAQLVPILPDRALFYILGGMVCLVATLQLAGWRPQFPSRMTNTAEWITGFVASFTGGLAAVWGPPILMYLMARETPKKELVRAQGIAFLLGSIVLVLAHGASGVLDARTVPFSAGLVVPAVAGMLLGQIAQDRLDQQRFRTLTLIVLVIAGANLLRRGFMS